MIRSLRCSALLLLLVLLLSACGQNPAPQPPEESGWSCTFTDSTGAEVTLTRPPETVAVLFSSYAEIWTLAGGTVAVTVGESIDRRFVPDTVPLVDGGAGKTIDLELLLATQPDFIIGSADIAAQADTCRVMREAGIPSALFRVDTFEDYLTMLKICTDITGDQNAYAKHGTAIAEEINRILSAVERHLSENPNANKEYLLIRAGSQYSATKAKHAPDNFVCTMLDELGAHNIADEATVLLDSLSLEEILLRNPNRIFLTTMGSESAAKAYIEDLFQQDGWNSLTAVKSGNDTFLPKDLFHYKPNARWAEAYACLAELLYPELNLNARNTP